MEKLSCYTKGYTETKDVPGFTFAFHSKEIYLL